MKEKRIAAFFDIDGTIYRDSLNVEHYRTLLQFQMATPEEIAKAHHLSEAWKKRQTDYEEYVNTVVAYYVKALQDLEKVEIDFTAKYAIDRIYERIYRYTRKRLKYHKEHKHLILFISGSADFLVRQMASKYNATDYRASSYLFLDQKFTGRVEPMWDSKSKQNAMEELKEIYNIDMEGSYAYGDTHGDLAMLKMVGKPIAINPTRELIECLQEDGKLRDKATIIVERKDAIYCMKPESTSLLDL